MTLHDIEDRARWEREDTPKYRALVRLYHRKLNRLWAGKCPIEEYHAHEARRPHPATGPDYFRAQTILRNLRLAVVEAAHVGSERRCLTGTYKGLELAEVARKAAHAARKIRPELFEGGSDATTAGAD